MQKFLVLCVSIGLIGCGVDTPDVETRKQAYSEIESDESVVFFRTTAWLDEARQEWHLPVHGWIYEPEDSVSRMALLSKILQEEYGLVADARTEANLSRRVNSMLADSERGKTIVVSVAGRQYVLPPSGVNGQFELTLKIPAADVTKFSVDSVVRYSAVTRDRETRAFSGEVLLVAPKGLSIISDIDDTVKISNVGDRGSLLEHTFFLDFIAVPGIARVYSDWLSRDGSLHFVSSSPWQLYTPLEEFLDKNNFPPSALSLKSLRFRDETLFDLFKKGTETKPGAIEKILNAYPKRQFMLVGDSGEQDPEVYAALLRKYPNRILKVYIRNVTRESPDNDRFDTLFQNVEKDRWQLFEHPSTLTLPGPLNE